jgi:WD40 repeat protein
VRKLQAVLSPVPTLILYSDMNDYEINIHIGFLSTNYQSISLIPIHPWNWEAALEKLQIEGQSRSQALRQVRQFIVTLHQILAAFLIDWYYLTIDPHYSPQLLQLTQEFSQELIQDYIAIIQKIQKEQGKKYQDQIQSILNKSTQRQKQNAKYNPENWQNIKTISAHEDRIDSLVIFPNNQWMASGSWDNTIKVWSVETGKLHMTLFGHVNAVTALAIDYNGDWLVSGSVDHTIKIWSVQSQQLHQTLLGHSEAVTALAVSSNGQLIASGSADNTIKIWSIATGEILRTLVGHTNSITAIKITPNGQFVISESADNTIKIWSVETGENEETLMYQAKLIKSVLISQDGQWILSFSWDNWIKIWSVATGELQRIIPGNTQENFITISSDMRWIASKSPDQTIRIRCLETGNLIKTLMGHQKEINQMAFSDDGNLLISSSSDGKIKIWRSP